jgi:CBS domain containing-hemolysin-like protein
MDPYLHFLTGFSLVLLLVFLNFYFVAAEFALVRSRPTKLRGPEEGGKFGTKSALKLITDLDLSLSATQLGITIASLVLGWYGEEVVAEFIIHLLNTFIPLLVSENIVLSHTLAHGIATAFALITVTVLHVVIGELAAKSLAIRFPESTLRILSPALVILNSLFSPLIFLLNGAANLFLSLFGLRTVAESERVLSSTELSMLVSTSSQYGVLDQVEAEMMKGIFSFSETVAREIMSPRTDMITIPVTANLDEVIQIIAQSGLSRFPVVGGNIDDVRGVLLSRDIIASIPAGLSKDTFDVKRLMRKVYFIPGTKPIDDLLSELRAKTTHMAIVLDEHGGVDGLVTMEDIIEEIVGDIFDESDQKQEEIRVQANGEFLIDGGVLVSDANERLSLRIALGDYDTMAGFVFSVLGRIAVLNDKILISKTGEVLEINGVSCEIGGHRRDSEAEAETLARELVDTNEAAQRVMIVVEGVTGNRIGLLRVTIIPDLVEESFPSTSSNTQVKSHVKNEELSEEDGSVPKLLLSQSE